MKRALAIAVAVCTLGIAGFGQLSGTWSQTIRLSLPAGTFSLRPGSLVINYVIQGFTITSTSVFSATDQCAFTGFGLVEQKFALKGAFGPFTVDAGMSFNAGYTKWYCEYCVYNPVTNTGTLYTFCNTVTAPEYMSGYLKTKFDFGGIVIDFGVNHYLWPYGCGDLMCETPAQLPAATMIYSMGFTVDPVSVSARFIDCCDGIEFADVFFRMKNVGFCCGITYDAELHFTKLGFDYVWFSVKNFFGFCCGISFDLNVLFTTTSKTVTLIPRWAGIEACAKIYADFDLGNGLTIYGWSLSCTLADCYKITVLTVLTPPPTDPKTCYPPAWYYGVFSSTLGEWEYIQFDTCGAACCGGKWSAYFRFYFGTGGGLFDLTRFRGYLSLPIMSNLTITSTYTYTITSGALTWDIGWRLTF